MVDPKFYENKRSDGINRGSEFTKGASYSNPYPTPFGAMPGYLTDMGIVRVPEKGFYGFKWGNINDGWGWVLSTSQDTFQNREEVKARRKTEMEEGERKGKNNCTTNQPLLGCLLSHSVHYQLTIEFMSCVISI